MEFPSLAILQKHLDAMLRNCSGTILLEQGAGSTGLTLIPSNLTHPAILPAPAHGGAGAWLPRGHLRLSWAPPGSLQILSGSVRLTSGFSLVFPGSLRFPRAHPGLTPGPPRRRGEAPPTSPGLNELVFPLFSRAASPPMKTRSPALAPPPMASEISLPNQPAFTAML